MFPFQRNSRFISVYLIAAGTFFASGADLSHYSIQQWDAGPPEESLSESTVTAVVQTRDSYLWVGTYDGLARFDGVRFTLFNDNNTSGLASSRITSLFEGTNGTLWIGHETGELTRFQNGKFEKVKLSDGWSRLKIEDLAADSSGDIWVLNSEGLLARVKDGLMLKPESGSTARVVEMSRSANGQIWVSRDGRVSMLAKDCLTPLPFAESRSNTSVLGICASRDGGVWIVSPDEVRKWKDGGWTQDSRPVPRSVAPLHRIVETRDGSLVAGSSDHGFMILCRNESPLEFMRSTGFPSDWVISLCEDREGNLWAGTAGAGLVSVRRRIFQTVAPPDQWRGRAILSVFNSRDGALWVGTEGAGLYRCRENKWENFSGRAGIANPYVWSLAEDTLGQLWIGTWSNGLFEQRENRFVKAPGLKDLTLPIPAMVGARNGGLWVGTGSGLLHYAEGKSSWCVQNDNSANNDVRTIVEALDGTVWFGTAGSGLGKLKDSEFRRFRKENGLPSDYIGSLFLEDSDTLWIGTLGGGLSRYKNGRFAGINEKQGLPNGYIRHIEQDGSGYFWMSSDAGIIQVSKKALNECADGVTREVHFRVFGVNDGLPALKSSAAGCKTADGRLWFGTARGLIVADPSAVTTNAVPPPVVIERMLLDEQTLAITNGLTRLLTVPPGRHRIEFQYTGLSFISPEKVRFKYRLQGLDSDWMSAGGKRTATYGFIPPGNYVFEVMAQNNDGVWSESEATIAVQVLPYFWQTLSFRILMGMALVTGAGGVAWFETRRRMRRELEKLERQRAIESERARIARDIHDDLGTTLTRITMLSDAASASPDNTPLVAENFRQIHDTARDLTHAMDEIVWAINPEHDTLDGLVAYLEKIAQGVLQTTTLRCRLNVPLPLPNLPLTADVRHNLFLAFKEALNNVIKHSAATELRIGLTVNSSSFVLSLEDNGRGFAEGGSASASRPGGGNGLINMQKRLAKIGGRCEIVSALNRGTKIVFTVTVA